MALHCPCSAIFAKARIWSVCWVGLTTHEAVMGGLISCLHFSQTHGFDGCNIVVPLIDGAAAGDHAQRELGTVGVDIGIPGGNIL